MFRDERDRNVSEREDYSTRTRYARYDYERGYDEERNRTPVSYRNSLQSSLERPALRSRLERADEARFDRYRASAVGAGNNYDKLLERKENASRRPSRKGRMMIAAIMAVAFIAVIAITMAVIGVDGSGVAEVKAMSSESLTAMVDDVLLAPTDISAAEYVPEVKVAQGGENYIMLKSGELVAIEVPKQTVATQEEEKGFDKLCSWLNGVFGG